MILGNDLFVGRSCDEDRDKVSYPGPGKASCVDLCLAIVKPCHDCHSIEISDGS